jgi:hypothetical protein
MRRLGRSLGLDTTGIIVNSLDVHLRRVGMTNVEKRVFGLPIGDWGDRVGSLLASDVRAAFTRLSDIFEEKFDTPREDCLDLIRTMQLECDRYESKVNLTIAFGMKAPSA